MATYVVVRQKIRIDGVTYSQGQTVEINRRRRDWRWLLEGGLLVEAGSED